MPHWYEVIRLSDATAADKRGSMVGFLVFMPILWGDPSIMFIFEPPQNCVLPDEELARV